MQEMLVLWIALVAYVLGGSTAIFGVVLRRNWDRAILLLCWGGLLLHTVALGMRWVRIGHGPFVTMFEILSSNLWGLMLASLLAYTKIRELRPAAAVLMPVFFILMGWMMMTHPGEAPLPVTYNTVWLFIHIGFAKVFFGTTLVAAGISGVILWRRWRPAQGFLAQFPADDRLEELAFRFMILALIFDSLMLIAGAIWAQDAWGRYWDWDPLETWSFLTWVGVALFLHGRVTFKFQPRVSAGLIIAIFALAFLTFLGVPFVSQAPHKGVV